MCSRLLDFAIKSSPSFTWSKAGAALRSSRGPERPLPPGAGPHRGGHYGRLVGAQEWAGSTRHWAEDRCYQQYSTRRRASSWCRAAFSEYWGEYLPGLWLEQIDDGYAKGEPRETLVTHAARMAYSWYQVAWGSELPGGREDARGRVLRGFSSYESQRPNTASSPSLGARRDLLQDGLGGSTIASPERQKSLKPRGA